ncbi:C69 family dipeptidase [Leptospira idonii]|uniref:Dipeptidase n=1 Tax=Leptospira idonii TaxID=1193500 RepID=A0A4R9M1N5_9LEPT|nr:C69 family dipeptidase [Leptospira idonii]TGN19982.1 peptidase C69 [Leptospira idonii]
MCDTSLATEIFTKTSKRIFSKNSDREPNEAQSVIHLPKTEYQKGTSLKTTFIEIPQALQTHEVLLCKPFQMWGAEMGVNEYGLTIGNEAVFTKLTKPKKNDGLTGMDLIRLALERCKTANEALFLITELLEKYGQDACGGYENDSFFYHNSFIIADLSEGFVLETADRFWIARKIQKFYAISNGLTIDSDYEYSSANLEDKTLKLGLHKKGKDFSFRNSFSDSFYTKMSHCHDRRKFHESLAQERSQNKETYSVKDAMHVLRSHPIPSENFHASNSDMSSLCLHATGPITPNQTNGSLIVEWNTSANSADPLRVWYTGTSTPCLSVFKPFFFGTKNLIAEKLLEPEKKADTSLWWSHETLARRSNFDYQAVHSLYLPDANALEHQIELSVTDNMNDAKKEDLQKKALKDHVQLIHKTNEELKTLSLGKSKWTSPLFQIYWQHQNRKCDVKL